MSKDPGIIRPRNCDSSVRQAVQQLATRIIGLESTPSFVSLTLTGLSASRLLSTDSSEVLSSVSDLTSWVAGVANEIDVADDGDGTITIGIVNPLIVGKGGTGTATLTDHGILLGSGTGAVNPLGVAANGQIPIGSVGADPVLAEITGTANQITSTPGAGTITLSTPQDIHTSASPTFTKIILANAPADDRAAPTLAFGDGDTGFYEHAGDDNLALSIGGVLVWTHDANELISNRGTGTPRLRFLNQAADIPAYTFSDDNNTGMWHPGANIIGFSTNGVECLRIDASKRVTFAGSINRTSGTLTLEIGETPQLSITNTALTLAGNLIMPDGGTIGQAAGPLLTFDDTNNFLEITGCKVGIGTDAPQAIMDVRGTFYVGYDLQETTEIHKPFAVFHAVGNVPSTFNIGLTDGAFSGMSVGNVRAASGSYNAQSIEFKTHHGGISVGTRMTIDIDGLVAIGAHTNPTARLHIDNTSGAMPVLRLDQGDIDDSFIDFIGTSAADGSRSISSDTTEDSAKFGAIRVEINGVTKWIRIYDDES